MSFSATRLTCYALLSALEEDLRRHINQNLGHLPPGVVFTDDEVEKTRARRRGDGGAVDPFSAEALLPYLDFADSNQILRRHAGRLPENLVQALGFVTKRLEKLVAARNRVAHTRPMDMDDLPNLLDLCDELVPSGDSALWEHLAETLNRIKEEPSFVLGMKIDLPKDPDTAPWHNLPVPDYDETGFFGRREQIKRIKKIIKGPYPVVSILGDGGIGKTSIALKVAYDLLDDPDSPFEAVVWVTAKATILTTNEIKRINDAIEDSLGLFAKAAEMFGPGGGTDPIREVLEYLEHFRVLLILDNLETVLDTKLREFLLELPIGSKVVLTSRIGAGVENPVSLDPLTDDESSRLMHALARIRDVKPINLMPSQDRLKLAKAMGGRPAYIRWFVAGVQSGRRPEELLKDNDLFLDFCMSNVYEYLSEDAREVIRCMQVLPGALSPAAIAFLTDFSASRTQSTLLELLTTNFVHMSTKSRNTSVESAYELTDFGKQYLEKTHRVGSAERRSYHDKNDRLRELGVGLQAENSASPFDPTTISTRDSGDYSAARLLRDAIIATVHGDYTKALHLCSEAQSLTPAYSEAWRVEGYVYTLMNDNASARESYERAYELDSSSAPLNYFFGSFLLDERIDLDEALEHLQSAARLDPDNPLILGQIAWAHHSLHNYHDAVTAAHHALSLHALFPDAFNILVTGLRSGVHLCRAELYSGQVATAVELMEEVVRLTEVATPDLYVGEAGDRLIQLVELAGKLEEDSDDEFLARKAHDFVERLTDTRRTADPELLDRKIGLIKKIVADKAFGFVRAEGTDYFFHVNDLMDQQHWTFIEEGGSVAFRPDTWDPKGAHAKKVSWID